MIELATLARPYAVAVYRIAKDAGTEEKWSAALSLLAQIMKDPGFASAARNPKAVKGQITQVLLELGDGYFDAAMANFVRLLVANRRLDLIGAIQQQFENYRAQEEGYVKVEVRSAYPLEEQERLELASVIKNQLGKEPRLDIQVDESLIGGVLIRADDRVIDASVRGQLQRLAKRLYN